MKTRIALISLLSLYLALAVVPAIAQTVYSNGPINGNTDAWTINFGFIVSDSFTVCCRDGSDPGAGTTISGASFGMWLFPGDTLTSAELSITSSENGGTSYFDQTVNFTQGSCAGNSFGFNVCQENTSFNGPNLANGTYWLNLQNASVPSGDPIYWDENSGPSSASENSIGTIPSEAFTVLGSGTGTSTSTTSTTTTGTVPEPSSIMLFGSGVIGLAGVLRRKFHL
ncbi:MAG: PEP-CTERM sorting domain-containing protein [Candidatus Korobacteraceae bacterium]